MILKKSLDTDSLAAGFVAEDIESLVRPELQEQWKEEQKKWFVQNPEDPWELRRPGLLKEEWTCTNGAIVWCV